MNHDDLTPRGVVCFGGEDWWYHNRGHCDMQFMRQFARRAPVLYINSIVMRRPNVGEGRMFLTRIRRKLRSVARGLVRVDDRFWVYSPVAAPVHHVPGLRRMNQQLVRLQVRWAMARLHLDRPLVWVNCPAACDAALELPRAGLVYQRTDRYEEFPGVDPAAIKRCDQMLKAEADLTFFSNRLLYEAEEGQCRRAAYIDHGVDYDLFAGADEDSGPPAELSELPRPIVGFFGGVNDHTFDIDLMARVVQLRPAYTFVFVGRSSIDTQPLTGNSNVVWIGQQPYDRIPLYGKSFDVCVMPWRQNRWIEGCNPIKLKEYLALGKPVVSTPFPELNAYPGAVRIARDAPEFAQAIDLALAERSPDFMRRQRERVAAHSWHAKSQEILRCLPNASRAA